MLNCVNGRTPLFLGVENCLLEVMHDGELITALLEGFDVFVGVEKIDFDRGLQIVEIVVAVLTLLIGALNSEFGVLVQGLVLAGFIRETLLEVG